MEKTNDFLKKDSGIILKCLVASFIILAICSKSSFLYPLNDWGDVSCYYIEGEGILHGLVPYRDLAEQKGPVIFFVYALALALNDRTFFGVFIVELISATIYLYFSLKTLGVLCDVEKKETGIAFAIAAITFSSRFFACGGGPEELSLSIFSFLLYLGTKYLENDSFPNKRELLLLGIGAGLLFWTKYILCAMYLVIFIFVLLHAISRKEVSRIWKAIFWIIIGILIVSVPVLAYFWVNNSLELFFKSYFLDNIFLYGTGRGFIGNLRFALFMQLAKRNIPVLALIFAGFIWMLYRKKTRTFMYMFSSFILTFVLLNCGHPHAYSSMPLLVFGICGIWPFVEYANKHIEWKPWQSICITLLFTIVSYVFCQNTNEILVSKEDTIQYAFARKMSEGKKDYSLLYYGQLDEGFYYAADYTPKWRAYVSLNQGGTELEDLQYSYVDDKEPDYIVTRKILCDTEEYHQVTQGMTEGQIKDVVSFDDFSYEIIEEGSVNDNGQKAAIRLYKKKS